MLFAVEDIGIACVLSYPEFIQLMDDDLVCLLGLTLLVDPRCRTFFPDVEISQLTLSLYLMARCQMKRHYPVWLITYVLDLIKVARRKHKHDLTLNRLLLNLTERKVLEYISEDSRV